MVATKTAAAPASPLRSDGRGRFAMARAEALIEQHIRTILATAPGERPMLPEFGNRAALLVFENLDAGMADLIAFYAREAIERWEPRVELVDVAVLPTPEGNAAEVVVTYRIADTGAIGQVRQLLGREV